MMLKILFVYLLSALCVLAQKSEQDVAQEALSTVFGQDPAIQSELDQLEQSIEKPNKPLFELDLNRSQSAGDADGNQVWADMSVREQADFYWQQDRKSLAERAYIGIVEYSEDTDDDLLHALTQLSELYYEQSEYTKAIDMLEQAMAKFPVKAATPERLYRLGEFYRDANLPTRSAEAFFRVINSIVVGGEKSLKRYLHLARLSKFEIARSHYINRDYARALALFDRIELLELSAENHETVLYYKILATLKLPELKAGLELIDTFMKKFPESEFLPELLYSKADVMMKLGEKDTSIALFMRLLDSAQNESDASERQRTFWHQQAGNRLANRFYAEGDYSVALRIYQGMVELNELPSWRIPVIYQIALCFEKMAMHERAQESYLFIEQKMKLLDADSLSPALRQIKENAAWRLKLIQWRIDAEEQATSLLSSSQKTR